jgi:hypothetical protein
MYLLSKFKFKAICSLQVNTSYQSNKYSFSPKEQRTHRIRQLNGLKESK